MKLRALNWLITAIALCAINVHATPFKPTQNFRSTHSVFATTSTNPAGELTRPNIKAQQIPPSNLTGSVYSSSTIEIFWLRASHSVAVDVYEIFRDGELIATSQGNSHVDRNLAPGTTYEYQVRARFADNTLSSSTNRFVLKTFQSSSVDDSDFRPDPPPLPGSDPSISAPPAPTGLSGKVYSRQSLEVFWDRKSDPTLEFLVRLNGDVVARTDGTSWYTNQARPGSVNQVAIATIDPAGNQSEFVGVELLTPGESSPSSLQPDAPRNFRGEVYSSKTIELFWQRSNPSDKRFRIFVNDAIRGDTNGTSFMIRNLDGNTTYRFSVTTIDDQGVQSEKVSIELSTQPGSSQDPAPPEPDPEENPSDPVVDPPSVPDLPPDTDVDRPAAPTSLRGIAYGKRTIELFWDRSAVEGTVYNVYGDNNLIAEALTGTSLMIRNLEPATDYGFRVSSISRDNLESTLSDTVTVTTLGSSTEPENPQPTDASPETPAGLRGDIYSRTRVEIFWQRTAPDLRGEYTKYRVYLDGKLSVEVDGNSALFNDVEGPHQYAVSSVNARGEESARSAEITLDTYNPVGQPGEEESAIEIAVRRAAELMEAAGATYAFKVGDEPLYLDAIGNIEQKDSVRPIASLSKPVTAYILQQMEAEGLLSLDDLLLTHVPEIMELDDPSRLLSLRLFDLVTHNSGLSHRFRHLFPDWRARLNYVLSQPPVPGYSYANDNFTLLTLVIINVLGSYQAGIDKYINVGGIETFRIGVYHGIPSFAGVGELEASAEDYFKFMLKSAPTSVEQNNSGYGIAWFHNVSGYLVHAGAHQGPSIGNHNSVAVYNATTRSGEKLSFVYLASGTNTRAVPVFQILNDL